MKGLTHLFFLRLWLPEPKDRFFPWFLRKDLKFPSGNFPFTGDTTEAQRQAPKAELRNLVTLRRCYLCLLQTNTVTVGLSP